MPTISPPDKVLVTGANGYIGLWVISFLLERGYVVRAAVRSDAKGKMLVNVFEEKLPGKAKGLEYTLVEDLTADHAYDVAVQDVAGVIHIASPLDTTSDDPQSMIQPAVRGTVGLLKSAASHGQALKRVIITSSIKALLGPDPGTYTEEHWAEYAVKEIEEKGREAQSGLWYDASKVYAEKGAWKFYEESKSAISWDISVINAGWAFGPTRDDPATPAAIPSTAGMFYLVFKGDIDQYGFWFARGHNYIDVRDLAEAHVKALEVEAAGGERLIVTSEWCTWQDWLNKANELSYFPKLDKGDPKRGEPLKATMRLTPNDKAKRILGLQLRTLPDILKDTLDYYRSRGWFAEYEA